MTQDAGALLKLADELKWRSNDLDYDAVDQKIFASTEKFIRQAASQGSAVGERSEVQSGDLDERCGKALAMCDNDPRATIKALLHANDMLTDEVGAYAMALEQCRHHTPAQAPSEPSPCAWTGYLPDENGNTTRCWGFGRAPEGAKDVRLLYSFPIAQAAPGPFQPRVLPWMLECFGPTIPFDKTERNHRFLEEALELVQACGCTQYEVHQLVDYVYGRDQGDINQEVGGVMVTLAALCLANGFDMHGAGETELARIWTKVEQIRAKQAAKPKHSPLPGYSVPSAHQLGPRCNKEPVDRALLGSANEGHVCGTCWTEDRLASEILSAHPVSAEDIARTICLSYGRDPDELTSIMEMCTADNKPVPVWMVYEEQAAALMAAYSVTSTLRETP